MGPFVIAFHSPAGPAGDVSPMFGLRFLIPIGPRPRRPPRQQPQTQLMPCLTGVMIGCVIAVHHCLAGAFLLRPASNTQTESQIHKFREVRLAYSYVHKLPTNTSALELISITVLSLSVFQRVTCICVSHLI